MAFLRIKSKAFSCNRKVLAWKTACYNINIVWKYFFSVSGSLDEINDAVKMINETGCDGVAVGRAALGNPWIFREIAELCAGRECVYPTVDERIALALRLTHDIVEELGELPGIRESRGRAAHFIKGIRGSSAVRDALNHAETLDEFSSILSGLL